MTPPIRAVTRIDSSEFKHFASQPDTIQIAITKIVAIPLFERTWTLEQFTTKTKSLAIRLNLYIKSWKVQWFYQFLCPPSLKSASTRRFLSSPTFVSLDDVKKKAKIIAPNLLSKKAQESVKFKNTFFRTELLVVSPPSDKDVRKSKTWKRRRGEATLLWSRRMLRRRRATFSDTLRPR